MTVYRAKAERDGHGWSVRVEGLNGSTTAFHARDLADIEPRALKLLWSYTGIERAKFQLDLHVQLPGATQDRLEVIKDLCADLEAEYEAVIAEMAGLGIELPPGSWRVPLCGLV